MQDYFATVDNKIYSLPLKIVTVFIFALLIYTLNMYTGAPVLSLIITNTVIFILVIKNMQILSTKGQLLIYVWLFLFKYAILVYNAVNKNIPMANADVRGFHNWASTLTNESEGLLDIIFSSKEVFVRVIALIYHFFGINDQQINFLIFVFALLAYIYIW